MVGSSSLPGLDGRSATMCSSTHYPAGCRFVVWWTTTLPHTPFLTATTAPPPPPVPSMDGFYYCHTAAPPALPPLSFYTHVLGILIGSIPALPHTHTPLHTTVVIPSRLGFVHTPPPIHTHTPPPPTTTTL